MPVDTCEWPECQAASTHSVVVSFPSQSEETWHVCRAHDRELKVRAVRSRPKKPPQVEPPEPNVVRCGGCGLLLADRSDMAVEQRPPCPDCGSTIRSIEVQLSERLSIHESLRARTKTSSKGGWMLDTQGGDNYTRDLAAWGKRGLSKDREHDLYSEVSSSGTGPASRAPPAFAITKIERLGG